MIFEGSDEVATGWPLGLGSIRTAATVAPPLPRQPQQRELLHSRSFSSFSSTNLDTESTASFFPDQSVSLGKLIGIGPLKRKSQSSEASEERSHSVVLKGRDYGQGMCAPLLFYVMWKKGSSNGDAKRH